MSNIQALIDTVQAEGLQTRDILSTEFSWFEYMNDNLVAIRESIVSIQERIFTFFDEEQARFDEAQRDLKAARRAEAERLKEAGAGGFTTPAKTSDGEVAETPTQEGGLLGGLGIVGLAAALGTAVAGYFAGLTTALAKGLTSVTKSITALFKIDNLLPDRKTLTAPFSNFFKGIKEFGKAFSALVKADDMKLFYDAQQKFGRFSGVATRVAGLVDKLIKFFAPLGEVTKLLPSGGKFLESIKTFGSKLGGILNVFAKIAVPLTAIIGTVKGIFTSFDEFGEDTSLLEKILITLKNVVKELISAFVTSLLELGKDIISWVAGALGFEEVEKFLDSFDIDEKFREIFDGTIEAIVDWFSRAKDALYQAAEAIGLVDVDPEAEARIAAREVRSARDDLAEADARVQQLEETISTSPVGSRERNQAEKQLKNAEKQRAEKAKDLQEAQSSAAEAQVFRATALDETTQDASLQAAEDSGLYDPAGFGKSEVDKDVLAQTTDVNQLKAIINDQDISVEDRQLVLDRIQELDPSAAAQSTTSTSTTTQDDQVLKNRTPLRQQLQQALDSGTDFDEEQMLAIELGKMQGVDFPSEVENRYNKQLETVSNENNQTATGDQISTVSNQTATGDQIQSINTSTGDQLQEVSVAAQRVPERAAPRVEPLSDLTNVTNINQAATAMQSALASIIPSEAGDLNIPGQEGIDGALSPAGIMGAGLGSIVDGVKNLTSLPVAKASQEVAAAKDKPQVVTMSGGNNSQVVNNTTNQQTLNMGAASARTQDISAQRLKDQMLA